jgi:hypothetical protein
MLPSGLRIDRRPLLRAEYKNARRNDQCGLNGNNDRDLASKPVSKHRQSL